MSLLIVAFAGASELLSRVISYSMDPVQDEGTSVDAGDEGTSVDVVCSDGTSVDVGCCNDNSMTMEAPSVVEDIEEEVSSFELSSSPLSSSVEGSFTDIDCCNDNLMAVEALDLSCVEDMEEEISSFEPSSSPLFSTLGDGEIGVESPVVLSLTSSFSACTGFNAANYRLDFDSDIDLTVQDGFVYSFEGSSVGLFSCEGTFMDIDCCNDNLMAMEALDLSFFEDMEEEVSSFELSSSPLFSTLEGGEMGVESPVVLSFTSSFSACTGFNTANYRLDFDSDIDLKVQDGFVYSVEGSSVGLFCCEGTSMDIVYRNDNSMAMEGLDLSFIEDMEEEVSSFELSSSPLFSTLEVGEMGVESPMALSFTSSFSAWTEPANYRLDFDSGDDFVCSVDCVEMKEDCMVPRFTSTPSIARDVTEKEICRHTSVWEDFEPVDELELCFDKQGSCPPFVSGPPVVYTRSGRRVCRPDRYGDWVYY